jgi:UDP-GlcNAc:undecaprenyl-phosphate GlcNAc-1-phosphate transferase
MSVLGWVFMLDTVSPAAASFASCLVAILALRRFAASLNLVDRPRGRKVHIGNVPIVGGLGMFLGIVLGLLLLPVNVSVAFVSACTLLVAVGLIDDRYDLSPWTRLSAQIIAASLLMLGSGLVVTTLGNPFGTGTIELPDYVSYGLTLVVTIAAINAFNMLDGMDGLAGGLSMVALIAIGYLAFAGNLHVTAAASLVFIGAIGAFLVFNFPTRFNRRIRCFMGDAGSTLLGFIVVALCIRVSQ